MAEHTVYHPAFASVTLTGLSVEQRDAHKAAGWRLTPLRADTAEPAAPKPSDGQPAIETDATTT